MNYKKLSKNSTQLISWGVFIWLIQAIVFIIIGDETYNTIDSAKVAISLVSVIIIMFGVMLYYMAGNQKRLSGETVHVWIESNQLPKVDGQNGKWFEFPTHAIPDRNEKIRIEDKSLDKGFAFMRITDKEYIFIGNELKAIKLKTLV